MRVVVSIVPIAFAYHMAHYLPSFLIQSQDAVRALSDPYGLGWDVLGTRDLHVSTSLLNNYHSVRAIWLVQVVAIVVGHVVAVAVAHVLALRDAANRQEAQLYQIPMILMMIGYTLFGLWLLSTPSAGVGSRPGLSMARSLGRRVEFVHQIVFPAEFPRATWT